MKELSNDRQKITRTHCDQPQGDDWQARDQRDTLTVEFILTLMAHGATIQEIIDEYKGLTKADIQACILFANK